MYNIFIMNKKQFIEITLNELNIPLKLLTTGKSTVEVIIDGYRKAGWNAQSYSNFTKKYFPDKKQGEYILTYLFNKKDVKHCKSCDEVKSKSDFAAHSSKAVGVQFLCIVCTAIYFKENINMVYYAAKRRAAKLDRTPKNADINAIKEFYKNCPEGYHVDHIIPLQGKNVSGLHIISNLQYLTPEENTRKGNKYDPLAQ